MRPAATSRGASVPETMPRVHPLGRILVVTPTFNEAHTVAAHVTDVRRCAPEVDVLVVDDSSPDGTGRIADRLAAADPQVHVLHRPVREGLGPAYVSGFTWALDRGYDTVVEMDADGSHLASDLPRLLSAARGYGLVIGSRWVAGGEVRRWSLARITLSRLGNAYTRALLGLPVRDSTAGFRVYRAELLTAIDYDNLSSHGYSFQVEGAWRAWRHGASIVEVPTTFEERHEGTSKMSYSIVLEAAGRVTQWGARQRVAAMADRLPQPRRSREA